MASIPVDGVLVFVADSLRYDALPREIARLGLTFKAVASSLSTPGSFTSIVSGLNAHHHGVFGFHQALQAPSLFDIPGLHTSFRDEDASLRHIWGYPPDTPLDELPPPFLYIERDMTTHAPYGAATVEDLDRYFRQPGTTLATVQADYAAGANNAAAHCLHHIERLRATGRLDRTLVLFTSDHGELLGEYGLLGHSSPACPELVYVPLVMIHPSLPAGEEATDRLASLTDILPTALAALGHPAPTALDGVDLLSSPTPTARYNRQSIPLYSATSLWEREGGRVFRHDSCLTRLHSLPGRLLPPATRRLQWHWTPHPSLRLLLPSHYTVGRPALGRESAWTVIQQEEAGAVYEAPEQGLDPLLEQRLRDLGYLS